MIFADTIHCPKTLHTGERGAETRTNTFPIDRNTHFVLVILKLKFVTSLLAELYQHDLDKVKQIEIGTAE